MTVKLTPDQEAAVMYSQLVHGLALIELSDDATLVALEGMLATYTWSDDIEHNIIKEMLAYIRAERVRSKIDQQARAQGGVSGKASIK